MSIDHPPTGHRAADRPSQCRGRRRDPAIDARVLEVTNRHLAEFGYEALSLAAVASEACTTRQALYRRWPTKASLAADAIRLAADTAPLAISDDPVRDLEFELTRFQRAITRPGAMSLVGTMLRDSTDDESRDCYRSHVIAPRRARIRAILEHAQDLGLIDADADLDTAVTLPTGSWFARALGGEVPPPDWASRMTKVLWRAIGGVQRT